MDNIDTQDALYLHFNKLLDSYEQIIIDDDNSLEYNIKTMESNVIRSGT